MHEDQLQTFTVIETREVITGIVANRDGKEVMSEYLGTDVAVGPAGMRWWDDGGNKRGLCFYGCVVQHRAGGDRVFKPEEILYGDRIHELPETVEQNTDTLHNLDDQGAVDFSEFTELKADAYAVLYEIQGYPVNDSTTAKIAYLERVVNGKEVTETPTAPVTLTDEQLAAMSGKELDAWHDEHGPINGYKKNLKVELKRGIIALSLDA